MPTDDAAAADRCADAYTAAAAVGGAKLPRWSPTVIADEPPGMRVARRTVERSMPRPRPDARVRACPLRRWPVPGRYPARPASALVRSRFAGPPVALVDEVPGMTATAAAAGWDASSDRRTGVAAEVVAGVEPGAAGADAVVACAGVEAAEAGDGALVVDALSGPDEPAPLDELAPLDAPALDVLALDGPALDELALDELALDGLALDGPALLDEPGLLDGPPLLEEAAPLELLGAPAVRTGTAGTELLGPVGLAGATRLGPAVPDVPAGADGGRAELGTVREADDEDAERAKSAAAEAAAAAESAPTAATAADVGATERRTRRVGSVSVLLGRKSGRASVRRIALASGRCAGAGIGPSPEDPRGAPANRDMVGAAAGTPAADAASGDPADAAPAALLLETCAPASAEPMDAMPVAGAGPVGAVEEALEVADDGAGAAAAGGGVADEVDTPEG